MTINNIDAIFQKPCCRIPELTSTGIVMISIQHLNENHFPRVQAFPSAFTGT
ncbi:hypothetical protein KsCSTR_38160 [Candidatus Kuenenia stuttgartiensis]|uniref:Uncharacterized protein n=1 Tax=Kuenenia stuttgartiensis TaxID=174633 RepID=Q1Q605_KUEST|nr:hypothetical protein KsCSTR_38160 [Candidatus Kuenenia stuttgartiensis]CAJ73007.1 unknown protein [Candidatus Kuenenia stuttgartiensis]